MKLTKRKSISKKTRFEVFKRDSFTCGYCGRTPPSVVLECDHIEPVALGGDNSEGNLITSCFDCNRGKAANDLKVAPSTIAEKTRLRLEKEKQLIEYNHLRQSELDRIEKDSWIVVSVLCGKDVDSYDRSKLTSIKSFLKKLPVVDVMEAGEIALSTKPYSENQKFKYFCGICWNKINEVMKNES